VIDAEARADIEDHIATHAAGGRVLKSLKAPAEGMFVPPTVIRLNGIEELEREIFGPVLHVATFEAGEIDAVVDAVNARGFGLTFGLHTRIDDRVQRIVERVRCGNVYVNRNQIGAVVGSQPFGGEGLSGTGPKAGGPHYVKRFLAVPRATEDDADGVLVSAGTVQAALDSLTVPEWRTAPETLPGPTGESNRLASHPRGKVLCLGPTAAAAFAQADEALAVGNAALLVAPGASASVLERGGSVAALDGVLDPAALDGLDGIDAVASYAGGETLRVLRKALAVREGALIPLISEPGQPERYTLERHVCVDTTAAGGNAALLAEAGAE
jgi:RHH-type proline utilization regulon transcriptional repressor/proline dehydrogenase/delta 1-pyrroline-5-carboxylate dehydrogenase